MNTERDLMTERKDHSLDLKLDKACAEQAAMWFVRTQSRLLSEAEQSEFKAWLEQSPNNRREFDHMSVLWHCAPSAEALEEPRQQQADPVRFSWRASEAWRSAVCPTIQRLTGMPAVEDMFNRNASATPAFLL